MLDFEYLLSLSCWILNLSLSCWILNLSLSCWILSNRDEGVTDDQRERESVCYREKERKRVDWWCVWCVDPSFFPSFLVLIISSLKTKGKDKQTNWTVIQHHPVRVRCTRRRRQRLRGVQLLSIRVVRRTTSSSTSSSSIIRERRQRQTECIA